MGNAVGPVTLIAAGIYLGYLTLTGRAANFVAFVKSGGQSAAAGSSGGNSAPTPDPSLSNRPGSSAAGDGTAANAGSVYGALPAGAPGTAAGMSQAQAAAAALQTLLNYAPQATNQVNRDPYVVGLLLALIVLSAIPVFASGITWLAVLLLIMVWTYALKTKATN